MNQFPNSTKFSKKDNEIVSRRIAEETIIVPIRGKLADMQRIFSINSVAEYIWEQLDGVKNLDEVLEGILTEFDINKEQAKADLEAFITELTEAGLITLDKGSS